VPWFAIVATTAARKHARTSGLGRAGTLSSLNVSPHSSWQSSRGLSLPAAQPRCASIPNQLDSDMHPVLRARRYVGWPARLGVLRPPCTPLRFTRTNDLQCAIDLALLGSLSLHTPPVCRGVRKVSSTRVARPATDTDAALPAILFIPGGPTHGSTPNTRITPLGKGLAALRAGVSWYRTSHGRLGLDLLRDHPKTTIKPPAPEPCEGIVFHVKRYRPRCSGSPRLVADVFTSPPGIELRPSTTAESSTSGTGFEPPPAPERA